MAEWHLKHSLEGLHVNNKEETLRPFTRLERLIILDDYDNARPGAVFFKDTNGGRSKGYIGWRD